jgi:redox-sensitive bicupin YhaK (pirin superfamily)
MIPPAYQDVSKDKIPTATGDKYTVKIISGEALGQSAIIATKVPLTYLDFHAEKGAKFTYDIPEFV